MKKSALFLLVVGVLLFLGGTSWTVHHMGIGMGEAMSGSDYGPVSVMNYMFSTHIAGGILTVVGILAFLWGLVRLVSPGKPEEEEEE